MKKALPILAVTAISLGFILLVGFGGKVKNLGGYSYLDFSEEKIRFVSRIVNYKDNGKFDDEGSTNAWLTVKAKTYRGKEVMFGLNLDAYQVQKNDSLITVVGKGEAVYYEGGDEKNITYDTVWYFYDRLLGIVTVAGKSVDNPDMNFKIQGINVFSLPWF